MSVVLMRDWLKEYEGEDCRIFFNSDSGAVYLSFYDKEQPSNATLELVGRDFVVIWKRSSSTPAARVVCNIDRLIITIED